MTVHCPQCASATPLSEAELGPEGRMAQCTTCGTRWLARVLDDDPYKMPALQPFVPSSDISDAVVIEHVGPGFARLPPPHRRELKAPFLSGRMRFALKVTGTVFGALVAIIVLRAPIVAALPGMLPEAVESLEFQRVRSETVSLRGLSTFFVEGEIINRSASEVPLPAIRVTLRSGDGDPVTSWLVEPAVAGLAAGGSIGFRSALASPPPDAAQVTLNLAAREGT